MPFNISTPVLLLSICFAALLPFSILNYALREKYFKHAYNTLPAAKKKRLFSQNMQLVNFLKIFLWFSPFYLVFVPFTLYYYLGVDLVASFACMLLLCVTVLLRYLFGKWLLEQLKDSESQSS